MDRNSQDWIADSVLEAMQLERIAAPDLTDEEMARRILMTAAPMAAQSVAWLSVHATAEAIRLGASKYIIDGVVGGGFKGSDGQDDVLMALVAELARNDSEPIR